jgi:hypothetical protein
MRFSPTLLVLNIFEFFILTTSISIGKTNQHSRLEYGAALRQSRSPILSR